MKIVEIYYKKKKKNTANENSSVRRTNGKIIMLLSNCAVCGRKSY